MSSSSTSSRHRRRASRSHTAAAAAASRSGLENVTSVTIHLEEQYLLAGGQASGFKLIGADVGGQPPGRAIRLLVDADGKLDVPRLPADFHIFQQRGPSPYSRRQIDGSEGEAHVWHLRRVHLLKDLPPAGSYIYVFFHADAGFKAGWYRSKVALYL